MVRDTNVATGDTSGGSGPGGEGSGKRKRPEVEGDGEGSSLGKRPRIGVSQGSQPKGKGVGSQGTQEGSSKVGLTRCGGLRILVLQGG